MVQYPHCIYGLPVLIYYTDERNRVLTLPLPEYSPDPDVTGMSWLPLDAIRRKEPLRPTGEVVDIYPDMMSCAVLVVSTHTQAPPELTNTWWAELFQPDQGRSIRVCAQMLLPYPEALEAGCALLSAARTGTAKVDTPRLFLSDKAWAWAIGAGLEWRRVLVGTEEDI